jgi:PAS domain S-box-containing protein
VEAVAPWQYPTDGETGWFDPLPTVAARKRRLAKAVATGGARLAATAVPALEFRYRKGYFGTELDLTKTLGEGAKAAAIEVNALLAAEIAADPHLRAGEVSPQSAYVELSHPDEKRLRAVSGVVDGWWKRKGSGAVRWTRPIDCETFQGQLVPLRLDLNDVDEPGWLIVSAAVEELREDIDDRFDRIHTRWVLPTLAVSLLLGVALVVTLTHSLNRLARAARRLSQGEDVRLPVGGSREVSDLAYTLDEMVRRVHQRDRELSDRAARYQTILRAAGEGVVVTDAAGHIEEANKAAGRMFGLSAEALLGRTVSSLLENPDALPNPTDSTQDETFTLPPGQSIESIRGRRADDTTFWMEVSLKPVMLPDRVVIVCVFRDVTRRKADAERIQRMNEDLESRVRVRTAELEEANGKLEVAVRDAEAAVRAKDSFVANMSHELRQPLHIIIGFTEALKEEAGDEGLDAAVRDLDKILAAAKHLLDLINDILDMAKISAGKMELTVSTFPLARLVEDVKTLVGPLAEANGNRFVVAADPALGSMTADERRVKQILLNLLSNAFKFTHNGAVRFAVERLSVGGREWVRFRVADSGKGMTAEQVGRLFQRFYQADSSTTRGAGGTGLGLAITQSFNDIMGGQPIRVTSAVGDGSEFVVTLPAVVETTPDQPPPDLLTPPEGTQSAEGRTVLVIDDDPAVRELMRRFLTKEGFAVVEAGTGDEGFAMARDVRPCVVTLDVMMPGSDGWAVLARLKADPATADIPVVMLTIVDDRGRGYSLGAADYLTKPIDWNRLGAILRKYLARGRGDTVLVVDDDPDNRDVIRRYLDREGWKTAEAADGEEGLRKFAETPPAVILLDLMMPVLDGFGFLDELAKRFPGHRVPVVILTAKELTPEDFDRLNGRVARILEKGDLTSLENLLGVVRRSARAAG